MLGIVNLDKPVGPTSHDMVALVRRLTGMRRIGHAGTLDPLASGVLPILVGAATRFSEDLSGGPKRYAAVIRLGIRSATDDAQGPLEPGSQPPEIGAVAAALGSFVGTFDQRPPAFSARKVAGVVAHRAARSGSPIDAASRRVTVDAIEIVSSEAGDGWLDVRCDIRCGPGTYIRAIARDLGDRLGCGGHLHQLRRTVAAGLSAEDAIDPPRLQELASAGRLAEAILPIAPLLRLPHLVLDPDEAHRFVHGAAVPVRSEPGRRAVFNGEGLIGIGLVRDGVLAPRTVIPTPGPA
ncbi:MAG TPA: tRNA pseudouridine(55) synthase TruB [Candidatus Limnocylindria bacterium]|nr:tRNA pseudouridine(55) synthase TruB [Candidatus Limnocylindria bacterium]